MSARPLARALGRLPRQQPLPCSVCRSRQFTTSTHRAVKPAAGADPNPKEQIKGPEIVAPRSYGKRIDEGFTPKPLPRPIGLPNPPQAGENTGVDSRSIRQRRDDFVDYDKHLARRKELTAQMSKPYFRDWGNLKFHEGKSFISPPRLFKAELSLYFPNFYGQTLVKGSQPTDTTPVLTGKASVVSVFSSQWAETQIQSFVSSDANPGLHEAVTHNQDVAQMVYLNYEDNRAKAMLVKWFMGSLRKKFPERDWDKYFLVQRGLSDAIREHIGLLNSKVGYTFLVDQNCRIRWAGSGTAHPDELEGLNRGLVRMAEEVRRANYKPATAREAHSRQHLRSGTLDL
ncbi:ATP10 protein-domain-containing protein [Emericellopsis atlantica]|uniref:ATP10 protein-domain-containing protein n=1 Tax=Emericellopsis atlantica TaxID=2614577 RepID=A0A9P7ZDL7_9HYPO|nr:ATP10 protein-domain-containing protein [Emericellopsis atlantica]KAG9249847.1 ATP10 protein-domain-containing protein [Emericellopsis atlantica]